MKYFGALWGGLSISIILFFIVVKGAKGSTIISGDTIKYIQSNSLTILLVSFVVMSAILQLLNTLFNFNILKFVVLSGTFGLAMAFAGNDLVNFIGVPLAGLASYKAFLASGISDPTAFSMGILGGEVKTETYLLIIAGLVMVATLFLSKKAKTVTDTEISLGRQDSGSEKFGSSLLARSIVRQSLNLNSFYVSILPERMVEWTNKRFMPANPKSYSPSKDEPAFDLIRASVNLTVASVLISFATSLKLPLSTTYVTFMVAMGSSLSDRAWGRESAVYRITGVITVIGGWFLTAFMAFSAALIIALVVTQGGIYAIIGFILLTILFVIRTHAFHRKKELATNEAKTLTAFGDQATGSEIIENCNKQVNLTINLASKILSQAIKGLINEDRKLIKEAHQNVQKLTEKAKHIKAGIPVTIRQLENQNVKESHKYIQIIDYLRELTRSVRNITEQAGEHVNNNHEPFTAIQKEEITRIFAELDSILSDIALSVKQNDFSTFEKIRQQQMDLETLLNTCSQNQVERVSTGISGSKSSLLFLNLLFEVGNLVTDTIHLIKAQRVFNTRNAGE
jgi:F0F1-type ATP synthase membrane subunit b/b'